jgi:hypothetical protein
MIAISAQRSTALPVRVEIWADGYRLQSALDSARAANSRQPAPASVVGAGKLKYAVAPGDEVTIASTTATGRVHVELSGEDNLLEAEGHAVTVRNRNGVISFDVQRSGAVMHFRYGTIL